MSSVVSLVTGSSSRGIGRGIVKSLATLRPDSTVVIHGLEDAGELDRVALEINSELGFGSGSSERRVYGVTGDVRKEDACRGMVDEVRDRFGGLDVLVNNAGCQYVSPIQVGIDLDRHAAARPDALTRATRFARPLSRSPAG